MGKYKHNETGTRIHNIWNAMMYRCHKSSKHKEFANYGGRGVSVCEEWKDYFAFKSWALNSGYADSLTLERVDNNGNYEPSNCTWIPKKEQALNRTNTVYVAVYLPLRVVCRLYDLSYNSTRAKIKQGYDINEIIKNRRIHNYEKQRKDY